MSDYQMSLFHPDLDIKQLLANINKYFEKAHEWPFPVGQNFALRNGLVFGLQLRKKSKK